MTYSKEIVREWLDQVAERAKEYPEWVDVFERCYTDTLDNTCLLYTSPSPRDRG